MRFTQDRGNREFRAIADGFSPAWKEARTRFALASGMSSDWFVRSWSIVGCEDAPVLLGNPIFFSGALAALDLESNGFLQPLKLHVVQVFKRSGQVSRKPDGGRR